MSFEFLAVEDVIDLHGASLERFGGADGIRDRGALESAVAQPQASFAGEYLHGANIYLMAAAYAFHIAEAQAFVDGNKRTALLAAIVFLDLHGVRIGRHEDILYLAMIEIAAHRMTKADLADLLQTLGPSPRA